MADPNDRLSSLLRQFGGENKPRLPTSIGVNAPVVPENLSLSEKLQAFTTQSGQTASQRLIAGTLPRLTPPDEAGPFSKGFSTGIRKTAALNVGGVAALADLVGADSARDSLLDSYSNFMNSTDAFRPTVESVEDINSMGQFLDWAAFSIGEQLPIVVSIVAAGGVGGILARLVGKKAITAKAAQLLKDKSKVWTEELAAASAKRLVTGRGVAGGVVTGATALETGGIFGEQLEAGLPLRSGVALIGGTLAGALETVTPLALGKVFGLTTPISTSFLSKLRDTALQQNRLVRAGTIAGGAAGVEGTTEFMQELIAIGARSFVDENFDTLGPEASSRILNSLATGTLLGFVLGGAGGTFTSRQPTDTALLSSPEASLLDAEAGETELRRDAPDVQDPISSPPPSPVGTRTATPDSQEVQKSTVQSKPKTITALTSHDVNPLQQVDLVDITKPEPFVEDPVITADKAELSAQKQALFAAKSDPKSYNRKGQLTDEAKTAILLLDDKIAEISGRLDIEAKPTAEGLVVDQTETNVSKLSIGQRKVFARLQDKIDNGEQLTDRENTLLDDFAGIISGDPIERDRLTVNQKQQIIEDLEAAVEAEAVKAQGEIIRSKNIQAAVAAFSEEDVVPTSETEQQATALGIAFEEALERGAKQPKEGGKRKRKRKAKASKAGGAAPTEEASRVAVSDAREAINSVRLLNEGRIVLVSDTNAIRDPRVKASIAKHDNNKFETQALHVENTDGTSYTLFLLDRMESAERVAALYLHEILVHHGLRGMTAKEKRAIIKLVRQFRRADMEAVAKARGVTLELRRIEDEIAEEVLAEAAEANDFELGFWNKLVAVIRQWLRKLLPGQFKQLTDNDVRLILMGLQRRLQRRPPRVAPIPSTNEISHGIEVTDNTAKGVITHFIKALRSAAVIKQLYKGTLTQGQLRTLAKKRSGSAEERDLVLSILDSYTSLRISPSELEQAILDKLIFFNHYVDPYATFVDAYVSDSLVGKQLGLEENRVPIHDPSRTFGVGALHPEMVIYYDTRQDVEFKSGHYPREPFYRGHMRGIAVANGSGNIEWIATEAQSDFAQQLSMVVNLSADEIAISRAVVDMADQWQRSRNQRLSIDLRDSATVVTQESIKDAQKTAEGVHGITIPQSVMDKLFLSSKNLIVLSQAYLAEQANIVTASNLITLKVGDKGSPGFTSAAEVYKQIAPSLFRRMLREDVRRAADAGYQNYSFIHPILIAEHEGWISPGGDIESMQPGHRRIYNRYVNLYKWFQREYGAREVSKEGTKEGFVAENYRDLRRMVIPLKNLKGQDIIALAGGRTVAGREATSLGADKDMSNAVDKLSNPLWTKLKTVFLSPHQMALGLKIQSFTAYIQRLTDWAAEKASHISEADILLNDTRKKLSKRDQSVLARIMFSLSTASDDRGRPILPNEKKNIYRGAGLVWSAEDSSKTSIQIFQERYEAMLDDINQSMQNAAMRGVVFKLIESGGIYKDPQTGLQNDELIEKLSIDFVDRYNDTDDFSEQRKAIVEELELLAATRDDEAKLALVEEQLTELSHLKSSYEGMRGRNYFPYKRFGKWAVTLKARKNGAEYQGRKFNDGQVAGLWTFENRPDQVSWLNTPELAELHQGEFFNLEAFKMSEVEESHVDIPPGFLDQLSETLLLRDPQRVELAKFALRFTPGSKFVGHMMKRRGIEGMSEDMERVFATYMQSAANHIARMNHANILLRQQRETIRQLKDAESVQGRSLSGFDRTGISIFEDSLKQHFAYIMQPGNELAWLRALGFTWYLGFNIKSAAVNLTQVPIVAYPFLAGKYGPGRALSALTKAIPDSTAFMQKDGKKNIEPWLDKLTARGVRELILDESLATQLAGAAQGDIMARVLPKSKASRHIHNVARMAAIPFQFTEKITRRMVFIATARLELAGVANPTREELDQAYGAAVAAVRNTIFEYAKWNRPLFMRGKLSPVFLFWTFVQNMVFTVFGGYGKQQAISVLGMLFLAAGTMGLPFMENLLDLLDFGGTKLKKELGFKDPQVDLRLELRKLFTDLPGGADLWMYGLSSRGGLGPLHILDLLGAPIPQVDVQGSIGLGRPVPGLEELTGRARTTDERFGKFTVDILGPVAAIFYNMVEAMGSQDPDTWKRFERTLPAALKGLSKASRVASRGGEEFRRGGEVIDYDPSDLEHVTEQIAQAFGFSPTRRNDRYKLRAHQEDHRAFYMTYRSELLEAFNYVRRSKDPEGLKDVKDAIKRYNRQVPDRRLKISGKTLARSQKATDNRAKLREEAAAFEKGFKRPFREIKKLFPQFQAP